MSWTLSATGKIEGGLEHLEQELHDALHKVMADPRFGMLFSHFQSKTVDQLHTVGESPATEPETAAPTATAEAAPATETAAAADPAPAQAVAKDPKAAAKTTAG